MKGDFTRRTFRREHHYRAVLLQQGRVQLDADWNEQVDIQSYLDRCTARDTIGGHGAPADGAGMAIVPNAAGDDLRIRPGRYYVDGILCENDGELSVGAQPDLPGVALPGDPGRYVAYLDVWFEHVTAVERPALREVALGGPDTATRARTIWQVRLAPVPAGTSCADVAPPWTPPGAERTGQLRARAQVPATGGTDPCVVPASAGFRGLENQLYRVEIRVGGAAGTATYLWSRENGSVVARLVDLDGGTVTIDAPGRDDRLGFAAGQWVEVVDTDRVRRGEPGFLGRLTGAAGTVLTVDWPAPAPTRADLTQPAVVRRWDSAGAVVVGAGWVDLEDGVQVEFLPGGTFRTGDHWLIPARTADLSGSTGSSAPGSAAPGSAASGSALAGDVEWPRDGAGNPLPQPSAGPEHRYAPLAVLDLGADGWARVSDCRSLFPPLAGTGQARYAGGDGQEALPGDALPQPLEVAVVNQSLPVVGARVRFTIQDDAANPPGALAATEADLAGSTAQSIPVPTGADGLARCYWRPAADPARRTQRVLAELLDSGGAPIGAPIHFTARLSLADQVWFDPAGCAPLAGARQVQEAIHRLAGVRSMTAVGGDGQDARPGTNLPQPVRVLVRTDCGPVAGARVTCAVGAGAVAADPAGLAAGRTTDTIVTGADGVAAAYWRLGPAPADETTVQVLTATLLPEQGAHDAPPTTVAFTANLDLRPVTPPALHVTAVQLINGDTTLENDSRVDTSQLLDGIRIGLDGPVDPALVTGKPLLTLTLDLPYPYTDADRAFWGTGIVGSVPLTLAGTVDVDPANPSALRWTPATAGAGFVANALFLSRDGAPPPSQVLARLTLLGWAGADPTGVRRTINGFTLVRPDAAGRVGLELPSRDDVRGANFTLWFWLVQATGLLMVVPRRTELFRLKTVRDALDRAVDRAVLRAALPGGIGVGEHPGVDLDGARRAVERGFRNGTERRLVLLVDERYAPAAAVIAAALGRASVEVEVVGAADPVATARQRVEAGDRFDGVLTDDRTAVRVGELGGFSEAIPL